MSPVMHVIRSCPFVSRGTAARYWYKTSVSYYGARSTLVTGLWSARHRSKDSLQSTSYSRCPLSRVQRPGPFESPCGSSAWHTYTYI